MAYRGTGIFIFQQSFENLSFGDQFFDADYGMMTWNGEKWLDEEEWSALEQEFQFAS